LQAVQELQFPLEAHRRNHGRDRGSQVPDPPGPAPKPIAVTGGTGIYRDVRGEGTLVEFGKHKGSITFRLTK
jgi:hypothetical protein